MQFAMFVIFFFKSASTSKGNNRLIRLYFTCSLRGINIVTKKSTVFSLGALKIQKSRNWRKSVFCGQNLYIFFQANKIFFRKTNFETIVLGVMPRPTVNFIKIGNGDRDLVFDLIWTHPSILIRKRAV